MYPPEISGEPVNTAENSHRYTLITGLSFCSEQTSTSPLRFSLSFMLSDTSFWDLGVRWLVFNGLGILNVIRGGKRRQKGAPVMYFLVVQV